MFSWDIWLATCDYHLIIDAKTNNRINFSKSIYIGDHVWIGRESAITKGVFVASGAILGAKKFSYKGILLQYCKCRQSGKRAKKKNYFG
ncbi:hypothetical protein [Campylobacter lanienae]|uniref:hypothetical protein n=1 Tax=Campylobacter lanienae TaxID=75658 RepID=UPI000BB40497|nr:hypothetical protein [Campylobacter lanienae]